MPVHEDISSEDCMLLAELWIKKCLESHPLCQQAATTTLPTRVVNVGSPEQQPFLWETNGKSGRYVALSHCWGKGDVVTTVADNLEDNKNSLPLESLPKTFQDAIVITRRLGFKFIWIDSLCIIQDSTPDWEFEAARMDQVYRNAFLTIAATSAADGQDGCFVPKSRWRESATVKVQNGQGETVTVSIRELSDKLHDVAKGFRNEPLSTRAWVLQESILSTRSLLYTRSELFFQCNCDLYCECGEWPLQKSYAKFTDTTSIGVFSFPDLRQQNRLDICRYTAKWAFIQSIDLLRYIAPSWISAALSWVSQRYIVDREGIYQYWRRIVKKYTARLLTFDRDVLPALSGLANMVRPELFDQYLAGIWRQDLPLALLWSTAHPPFVLTDTDFELAKTLGREEMESWFEPYVPRRTPGVDLPTWSWVSVRGATDYDLKWLENTSKLKEPVQIISAKYVPALKNPTGRVSGASLTLSGNLAPVLLGHYEWDRKLLHRCRVGDVSCEDSHTHTDACVIYNEYEWAVLDVPPQHPQDLCKNSYWRLRIGIKPPPHHLNIEDYAGQFLQKQADLISRTHVIYYYLILKISELKLECYERVGLHIRTRPVGEQHAEGPVTKLTLV